MIFSKYKIPIYFGSLWVCFSDDFISDGKSLGINFESRADEYLGIAFRHIERENVYCIFIKKDRHDDVGIIVHESVHIVNYIFKDRKIKLDLDNDEHQAYLTEFIVDLVIKTAEKVK